MHHSVSHNARYRVATIYHKAGLHSSFASCSRVIFLTAPGGTCVIYFLTSHPSLTLNVSMLTHCGSKYHHTFGVAVGSGSCTKKELTSCFYYDMSSLLDTGIHIGLLVQLVKCLCLVSALSGDRVPDIFVNIFLSS